MSGITDRQRRLLIGTQLDQDNQVRLSVQDVGTRFGDGDTERLFEAFLLDQGRWHGGDRPVRQPVDHRGSTRGDCGRLPTTAPGVTISFAIPVCRRNELRSATLRMRT